jgi:hypothetical protein
MENDDRPRSSTGSRSYASASWHRFGRSSFYREPTAESKESLRSMHLIEFSGPSCSRDSCCGQRTCRSSKSGDNMTSYGTSVEDAKLLAGIHQAACRIENSTPNWLAVRQATWHDRKVLAESNVSSKMLGITAVFGNSIRAPSEEISRTTQS